MLRSPMLRTLVTGALAALTLAMPAAAQSQYGYGQTGYGYGAQYQDPHCQADRRSAQVKGAVIGAIVGGLAGRSIAASKNEDEGTAFGALAGGAVGAGIASRNRNCDTVYQTNPQGYSQSYGQPGWNPTYGHDAYDTHPQPVVTWGGGQPSYGYGQGYGYGTQGTLVSYTPPQHWDDDDRGYGYGHDRGRRGHRREACGWGEAILRAPNGAVTRNNVWMCRARDGQWYVQQQH